MKVTQVGAGERKIAVVNRSEVVITDVQSALDLIATVQYETGCDRMIISKSLLSERFFDLKTKLAGDILQKFIQYRMKLAIVGDFSVYASESLKAFIYESNKGNAIFFMPTEEQAIERLSQLE